MVREPGGRLLLILLLAACREPVKPPAASPPSRIPPTSAAIGEAAVAAVVAAPWDHDPTGWGALCTAEAPCDTLVIEPRIVSLPAQAPAFFVPDRRDQAAMLTTYALGLMPMASRHTVLGSWRQCSGRRDSPQWAKGRVACVALAVAGFETASADAITFALLVASPARGLSWPRVRVTRPRESWRGRLLSNASR